jgi:hypothetical protein
VADPAGTTDLSSPATVILSAVRIRCLTDAVAIHVARFLVMLSTLYIAGWLGVDGWYRGFVVNVVVTSGRQHANAGAEDPPADV